MDRFEAFDLKITKLSGKDWDRTNPQRLLKQLFEKQGNPRYSIENRIFIAFDNSPTSHVKFFKKNKKVIVKALLKVALDPYSYTYWLSHYNCWASLVLIKEGEYEPYEPQGKYHEHPIGLGMREREKAEFEHQVILEVSEKSGYRIRPNRLNPRKIGDDAELKIDTLKIFKQGTPQNILKSGQLRMNI